MEKIFQACVALSITCLPGHDKCNKKSKSFDIDKSFPLTSIKQETNTVQGPGQGFYLL